MRSLIWNYVNFEGCQVAHKFCICYFQYHDLLNSVSPLVAYSHEHINLPNSFEGPQILLLKENCQILTTFLFLAAVDNTFNKIKHYFHVKIYLSLIPVLRKNIFIASFGKN